MGDLKCRGKSKCCTSAVLHVIQFVCSWVDHTKLKCIDKCKSNITMETSYGWRGGAVVLYPEGWRFDLSPPSFTWQVPWARYWSPEFALYRESAAHTVDVLYQCEWVNGKHFNEKHFEWSSRQENCDINTDHLPFNVEICRWLFLSPILS